jgi:tetratricopeptide (TPR) repeat protein
VPSKKKKAPAPAPQELARLSAESRRLFDLANDNFRNGRYEAAAAGYSLSNDFTPHPRAANNAAVAQQRALEARQQAELERRKAEASKFHEQGVLAAKRGDYKTAQATFGWANELVPNPRTASNVAYAEQELAAGAPEQASALPSPEVLEKMSLVLKKRREQF